MSIGNLDLLVLGVAIAAIATLGFIVFFNNPKSTTNRMFLAFSFVSIIWGVLNFASYQATDALVSLWLWRLVIFSAVWFCFGIFHLSVVFPQPKPVLSGLYTKVFMPLVALTSVLTLTPFVFAKLLSVPAQGVVPVIENGPLIPAFGLTVGFLVIGAVYQFIRKMRKAQGALKQQYLLIMLGTFVTFALLILFNFVLPTSFQVYGFIPFGAVFIFPFIAATGYAIFEYKLFDVKVIGTQIFAFVLTLVSLIQLIFSTSTLEVIVRTCVFVLVLVFAISLIRSVMREVKQREEIERLAGDLKAANERLKELDKLKSEFLSIASHDLRAPLTVIRNFVSLLMDGTYGKLPSAAEEGLRQVFDRATDMAKSVDSYLNVSRIEQGRMKYDFIDVELSPIIKKSVADFKPNADKKGVALSLTLSLDLEGKKARLDISKINEVLNNLLDNSIKYTPKGSITVTAEKVGSIARVTIKDSGVGMSPETIKKLFQLFSTGTESLKVNTTSTGVGLYITKAHAEAHKGRIWAESEGEGKGSTFILELPLLP